MSMSVVLAYVVLTTGGPSDPELHWNISNVPYKFNASGSNDLGPEVYPALDAGFQVWNAASGIDYSYDGCTSKGKNSIIDGSGDAESDGSSVVTWVESNWPYSPGTIAITWTYFFSDGEIGEADMLMNGEDYFWTTSSSNADTDVQSIAAHESGHYLGLGHSNDAGATMFATVDQGETSKRSLSADDIAGAQYLYGGGPSGGASFSGECAGGPGAGDGEGCACSLEGTGAPRPGLLAGVLAVLGLAFFGMMRLREPRLAFRVSRRAATLGIAALALLASPDASATVMIDQSLEQLAAESSSVIHGDVTKVEVKTDGRIIWTVAQVRVREVLAGIALDETVEIVTPGGTLPANVRGPRGYQGVKAVGLPDFSVDQEVVVFLAPSRGEKPFLTVAAFAQGLFTVQRDGAKPPVAVRDVSGIHRVMRTDEGMKPVEDDSLSGLPLTTLFAQIRVLPTRVSPGR